MEGVTVTGIVRVGRRITGVATSAGNFSCGTLISTQNIWTPELAGWIDVPLFHRAELALNQHIAGPAIVEEYGSTIVIPPTWSLHTDRFCNLILVSGR